MDLSAFEANYTPFQFAEEKQKPKVSAAKQIAASLLPTIGGALGAVGGSFVAPIAGTAAGGAAGSALGEALRQRVMGEDFSAKKLATEGALGAVPGVFKGAKAGVTTLKGAKAAKAAEAAQTAARTGNAATNIGKLGVGAEAQAGRDAAAKQIADAQQFNSMAKQNVQNLAQKSSTQGLPLGESGQGGVLVKPGATPSFASEGVELKPVPDMPFAPERTLTPRPPVATTAVETSAAKPTLFGKMRGSAKQANDESKGVVVGQGAGRGKVVTPDDAATLNDFMSKGAQKYGGIRSGRPIDQANDAQTVFNNVKKGLDDTLTKIDRPLQVHEPINIGANIAGKIRTNPAITSTTKTFDKFDEKIKNAKSLKELETIRREADDLAFTATGAGKTSAAAQARAVRDGIDEFITPLSSEYKAIKGDYPLARDALQATSKASKDAKGLKLPFTDIEIGKQALPGVKNKASAVVAGKPVSGVAAGEPSIKKQVGKSLFNQITTRAAAAPFMLQSDSSQSAAPTIANSSTIPNTSSIPQLNTESLNNANDPTAGIDAAIQQAMAAGDYKGLAALMSVADYYDKKNASGAGKPLSAEASKVVSNAQTGIQALNDFNGLIDQDPDAFARTNLPGVGTLDKITSGRVSGALGTSGLNAARQQVIDIIARLRTGAAISNEEAARFEQYVPQPGDPPEARSQKTKYLMDQFQFVAQRSGGAGNDLQAALGAQ